ncbi:prephenate/arogenate dehydrogenase family protein [Phenylobacterium montanum]|uniref:prephenate dehydrogenase n=1 Tax=Phenylobacterium montanum TaxID=2823693 RepID=A0A975ITL9_9CAUL|nr:prephenate/arogenate dehydrogenase family protein [Caulobacter sp. S6]QUD86913.1 prephenate/arogenate dehydrogenase family protein [Caulobacter sp. S6]
MSFEPIPRLAVIGCGLIGSSVARAARASHAAETIVIFDANPAVRERVRELGMADLTPDDPIEAVRDADLVIFAAPPAAIGAACEAAAPGFKPGAIISDVGSVKGAIGDAMAAASPAGVFVIPGHPIAGTEQSGPDAGFPELFEGRWTILCPRASDDPAYDVAVARLSGFWRALGAQVELMDAAHHDRVLAVTSHLPHLIAYNIVGTAADLEEVAEGEVMKYSAGGFRDFTRIAASDPVMWRDVFLLNKDAVLEILGRFNEDLQALSRAIRWGEGDKLEALFTRTRAIRRGIVAAGQESAEPNFGRNRKGV